MPLKAKINGKTVISIDMNDEEWDKLKKAVRSKKTSITLLCCNKTAYTRTSKLGTKHFVHKTKKNCNWESESIDHLRAKEIVYKACIEEGWYAEPEYSLDDCIADIFATDGKRKVGFEIQLSKQTKEDTINRHKKYVKHGIKCVWFLKRFPRNLFPNKNFCAFSIFKENDIFFTGIDGEKLELDTLVKKMIRREIRFRDKHIYRRNQIADIYKFNIECWKCGRQTPVISVNSNYISCCGVDNFNNMNLTVESLGKTISELQKKRLKELSDIGTIKKRYSKTIGSSYWSNGCKWCGALIGKHFLLDEFMSYLNTDPVPVLKIPFSLENQPENSGIPHWCMKNDEGFCEI